MMKELRAAAGKKFHAFGQRIHLGLQSSIVGQATALILLAAPAESLRYLSARFAVIG